MADPVRVRECLSAMANASGDIPISAKIRIGIDEQDPDETLLPFVAQIADLPLNTLTVHARKAILKAYHPNKIVKYRLYSPIERSLLKTSSHI